ncbi:hypothetical protein ALP60_02993 [Pseudomonas savastanoi]|uniref:Uncharacterized protein n=1 Tax=Pseudomonas savastanoi TaxID=29438 RepID=A0A3M5FAK7_PSESS|nr:hypothetical protein ALP60_02993 [Pseudomonas savastanoi]
MPFGLLQLGLQLLNLIVALFHLLIELIDRSFLHQNRLRHVIRRSGLASQMLLDARLGRSISRSGCRFGIFQFREKTINQGLLFAVHDHLTELPLEFFPAAPAGPCSENGASSTRFNDMKKKIRSAEPTTTALGSAGAMG